MLHIFAVAFFAFASFFCSSIEAATPERPAYRTVLISQGSNWQDGLLINFAPDKQQCMAKYGRRWQEKCATSLGKSGDTVTQVKLSPNVSGHWQWLDGTTLNFIPSNAHSLAPNTTYSVDLTKLYRPSSTIIDKQKVFLTTMPLAVRMPEGKFWIDPSPKASHRLAAFFEFNYPLSPTHDPVIDIAAPKGAKLDKPEMVWNQSRDKLNISWPVRAIQENTSEIRLILKGFGEYALENGVPRYYSPDSKTKGAIFRITVPGSRGIFQVKSSKTKLDYNKDLDRIHVLEMETSLYAKPEDIAKRLRIWELPKYNSKGADRPYNWQLAPAVPTEVLKKSKVIKPESLQKDNTAVSRMSFRIPVESGRYILLALEKDCPAASGETLAKPFVNVIKVEDTNPVLGFLQPGNVLPLTNNAIVDIYASGLDKVAWQAQFAREPFLALLAGSGEDAFQSPLERYNLDMTRISESQRGSMPLPPSASMNAQFAALDLGPFIKKKEGSDACGLMRLNLVGIKDGKEVAWASRMILATDIGILVKHNVLGGYDCFAYSLKDGRPLEDAAIGILGANGKLVAEKKSDSNGHAAFSSHSSAPESKPVAIVARNNNAMAWLPLQDRARELNFSDFPVGGSHSSPDGLNAFVFSQRGLYRPGDTLHFGCITRRADFALMPCDMPLQADLSDPIGRTIFKKKLAAGKNGISTIDWPSPENALSGLYTLNIRPQGSHEILGYSSVRLEEFQPDTLKLHIELPVVKGWLKTGGKEKDKLVLNLRNLYGSPASGHKVKASLFASPANFRFRGYEDYVFTDALPLSGHGSQIDLPSAATDKEGNAIIDLPTNLGAGKSALINVLAEGFEAGGGRATAGHASILVSPLDGMLGYKPLGSLTNLQFIPKGEKAELAFLALNSGLEKIPLDNLSFSTSRRRYVTSLVEDGNGGYRYDETPLDVPLHTIKHNLPASGLNFSLPTEEAGEYMLNVVDPGGMKLAQIPFAVSGSEPLPPNSALGGSKMRLRLDKTDYNSGDTINLAMSVPYDGTGLITIERDGVEAFEWFNARAGDHLASINIPKDFEGRGYVGVTFVRSAQSSDMYVSPLTYAVAPFTANITNRDMGLALGVPKQIVPGDTLSVRLASKQPGLAVVCAVDEGILQLSNFKSPDPLKDLLLNRALDVRTLQALDLLMPEHSRLSRRFSAFGGGLDGVPFGSRFQNPFKRRNEPPVVFWSGLVEVGKEANTIDIPIPDYYNGKLRIMAVGAAANSAGNAVGYSTVVAPLVITPQIPVAASPGDIFEGALVLANTTDNKFSLKPGVTLPDSIEMLDRLPEVVELSPNSELVVPFKALIKDNPGACMLDFKAVMPQKTWRRKAYISIRPQSPLLTTVQAGYMDNSSEIATNRQVYPQMAHADVIVSPMPLPLASGFAKYLESYPYGCTEQLVSKAFAQVYLGDWPGFAQDGTERDKIIEAALGSIRSRFNGQGVSLWPDGQPEKLLTIYVADFMLSLRENGFGCPEDLLQQVCDAVEADCALNEAGIAGARNAAYALWVLTRQGRITTQLLENLLGALNDSAHPGWKNDITALLISASQREMHIPVSLPVGLTEFNPSGWFDEYALKSMRMAILARYFPDLCTKEVRRNYFQSTIEAMNNNLYATFSASQGIRALMAVNEASEASVSETHISCVDGEGQEILFANGSLLGFEISQCDKYKIETSKPSRGLFWQLATTGFNRNPTQKAAHGVEIEKHYLDRNGNPIDVVEQGEEITVRIVARAMQSHIQDCVISDLLPGGFEMVAPNEKDVLPDCVKFADRREDRMLIFSELTNQPLEFKYRIRAINPGKFSVAPVSAQAMYAPAIYGNGETSVISIAD